jgi:small subunit ribosomal protein S8e
MAIYQIRSKRKLTGGRYKKLKVKKLANSGNLPRHTNLAERRSKYISTRSNNTKQILLSENNVNVFDAKSKTHKKVKIDNVIETPDNRNFVTRNILTKGAIVKTELGNVKLTSRPGQTGSVEGVLVQNNDK